MVKKKRHKHLIIYSAVSAEIKEGHISSVKCGLLNNLDFKKIYKKICTSWTEIRKSMTVHKTFKESKSGLG